MLGGGAWNREKFAHGLTRSSGEVLITEELGVTLLNRLKLSERLAVNPNITNSGELRVNVETGLSLPINR